MLIQEIKAWKFPLTQKPVSFKPYTETTETSGPFDEFGRFDGRHYSSLNYPDSVAWIPVSGNGTVDLSFWYKNHDTSANLYAAYPDGAIFPIAGKEFVWSTNGWALASVTVTLPENAVAIGLDLLYVAYTVLWRI